MRQLLARFARADGGITSLEYGLIAALIAIACIVAFQALGISVESVFNNISAVL